MSGTVVSSCIINAAVLLEQHSVPLTPLFTLFLYEYIVDSSKSPPAAAPTLLLLSSRLDSSSAGLTFDGRVKIVATIG